MEHVKHGFDAASAVAALVSLMHLLPELLSATAAALSMVWSGIRIYEWLKSKRVKE